MEFRIRQNQSGIAKAEKEEQSEKTIEIKRLFLCVFCVVFPLFSLLGNDFFLVPLFPTLLAQVKKTMLI